MAEDSAPPNFWGSRADRREAIVVLLGALLLSVLYTLVASRMDVGPSRLEFIGTTTGLANVWLVRKQNILSWPLGAVMVASVGWVFFDQYNLMGQALIHLLYFFPVQFWGWYHWVRGGEEHGELGLSWTPGWEWLIYVPVYVLGTWALGNFAAAAYDQAAYVYWDASIVAASVIALFLQGRKKVESWFLWIGPVNIAAIGLYSVTGATMFAALYVVFLANAIAGAWDWARESRS
jgi:nicotinamide mononucleotide transporter